MQTCDFITDMGHATPLGTRAELRLRRRRPAVARHRARRLRLPGGHARLRQIFPDVSVAEIRRATGFDLTVAGDLRPVNLPSSAELAVLRSVDPLEVRKSELSPRELARVFTIGSATDCAC